MFQILLANKIASFTFYRAETRWNEPELVNISVQALCTQVKSLLAGQLIGMIFAVESGV